MSQVPHVLTEQELRSQERYAHSWAPKYDSVPTGRLRLRVINGPVIHVDKVADGKVRRLEDQLAAVMWEVELRVNAADERQRLAQLEAQERQLRWAQVRAEAEEQLLQEHRASTLHDQVRRWREAQNLDVYVDAVQQRVGDLAGPEKEDATQWLAWGRSHRDRLDPLRGRIRMPQDPDITATALAPYMRGMSPYGP